MKSFDGKVALIAGGSSGIGLGIAKALAENGAKIALVGTSDAKLKSAVSAVAALGAEVTGIKADVGDQTQWAPTFDAVEAQYGAVELLFLNAGAIARSVPIEETTLEEWRWVCDVNLHAVFYGLKTALPRMKASSREAHIVVTSSIGALAPMRNAGPYGATKAAVLALCDAVRMELAGSPIGISVMCPAGVNTLFNETAVRNAPNAPVGAYDFMRTILDPGMDPLNVGRFTLKCIQEGRFYIFTHPGFKAVLQPRYAAMLNEFKDSAEPGSPSFGA